MDLLDPSVAHYGRTYAEWAAAWIDYVFRYEPPDCFDPIADVTGEHCELNQDANSSVFFLVGTYGGVAKRSQCQVPGNKALFFPLGNVWGDNTGIPIDQTLSDAELKANTESAYAALIESKLHLSVDGRDIDNLTRGAVPPSPYVLHMPAEPNTYTCLGVPGVEGDFPGYVAGYFAMLPALGPGAHVISFASGINHPTLGEIVLDVQYEFTSP